MRVNGDSPLFEPSLINAALHRCSGHGLVTNLIERRFPYGVAIEIVDTVHYLNLADTAQPEELEHVTRHLYRQADTSTVLSVTQQEDHSHLHVAVDTLEDYERVHALFYNAASPLAPYWELYGLSEPVLRWNGNFDPL